LFRAEGRRVKKHSLVLENPDKSKFRWRATGGPLREKAVGKGRDIGKTNKESI
jgi:hypothetical protein